LGRDCEPVHERGEEVKGSAGGISRSWYLSDSGRRWRPGGRRSMKITEDWWTVIVGFIIILISLTGFTIPWKIFSYGG